MMEKYGNQAIHAYAESRGWKDGSAEKSSSMELLAPSWETWEQERLWQAPCPEVSMNM